MKGDVDVRCRYDREIYSNPENGYCIFQYLTEEPVPEGAKNSFYKGNKTAFVAVGYHLPNGDVLEYELNGTWAKGRNGLQFAVEYYDDILSDTEDGIYQYLSSGAVKGIGPKTAEAIVNQFGRQTFEIFDAEPEKLLSIKGITEKKLSMILMSYQEAHSRRELTMLLAPYQLGPGKIAKVQTAYGDRALEVVRSETYELCKVQGFSFTQVDRIAMANNICLFDPQRIRECLRYVIDDNMRAGNLYMDKETYIKTVYQYLNHGFPMEAVSRKQICAVANQMFAESELVVDGTAVYTKSAYEQEEGTANAIAELLLQEPDKTDIISLLKEAQEELGIQLAMRQEEAVIMAFRYRFSIITGGPGTGKTTVEKVILYIHQKIDDGTVLLMAPTGKASRRMAESTGYPEASTMHSALGIVSDDEDFWMDSDSLEASLLLADEFSMVDMKLGNTFFGRIDRDTRVVLVGDVKQLPSVGPGNVFRELIESGIIPLTVLDVVFRQDKNSRIVQNADLMQKDQTEFAYGEDFVWLPVETELEAKNLVRKVYADEVKQNGVENVQILTPRRKGDGVSVNGMNEELHEMMNPARKGQLEMKAAGHTFRAGDKIIQNKNKDGISNGDSGFIKAIYLDSDGIKKTEIAFGSRIVEYDEEQMEMVEHAYIQTVHKSQGSEYPVVILPWLMAFRLMLKRNILYTAITRAKVKLIIIGQKRAIEKAVHNTKNEKRLTRLGERLTRRYYELLEERRLEESVYEQMAINF